MTLGNFNRTPLKVGVIFGQSGLTDRQHVFGASEWLLVPPPNTHLSGLPWLKARLCLQVPKGVVLEIMFGVSHTSTRWSFAVPWELNRFFPSTMCREPGMGSSLPFKTRIVFPRPSAHCVLFAGRSLIPHQSPQSLSLSALQWDLSARGGTPKPTFLLAESMDPTNGRSCKAGVPFLLLAPAPTGKTTGSNSRATLGQQVCPKMQFPLRPSPKSPSSGVPPLSKK